MKLKRAKAYRKLMHQYEVQFNFREPYQVLLDSRILEDAYRSKIDLIPRLEGVLQGKVKPMITQCSIRHLYNAKPKNDALINQAKDYERRRCNHHELENPLSSLECLSEVVDPKDNLVNKHRYVVASQDPEVRAHMRRIAGVPLLYISRSVLIMEPMNTITEEQRDQIERQKFKQGLKGQRNPGSTPKRKREDEDQHDDSIKNQSTTDARPQKKNKRKGPKEPNPLSMKKSKKAQEAPRSSATKSESINSKESRPPVGEAPDANVPDGETSSHRKRKRRPKHKGGEASLGAADGETV